MYKYKRVNIQHIDIYVHNYLYFQVSATFWTCPAMDESHPTEAMKAQLSILVDRSLSLRLSGFSNACFGLADIPAGDMPVNIDGKLVLTRRGVCLWWHTLIIYEDIIHLEYNWSNKSSFETPLILNRLLYALPFLWLEFIDHEPKCAADKDCVNGFSVLYEDDVDVALFALNEFISGSVGPFPNGYKHPIILVKSYEEKITNRYFFTKEKSKWKLFFWE